MQLGLRHDHARLWRYSPLQSEFAARELARHGIEASKLGSIHALADYGTPSELLVSSSDAALMFWRSLPGWPRALGTLLSAAPRLLREPLYRTVARNRYRWFGRYDTCKLPSAEQQALFFLDPTAR